MVTVDLYSASFWVFVGLAMLVVVPLRRPRSRKFALALLNVGFLYILLAPKWTLVAVGLLFASWVALRVLGSGRVGAAAVVSCGAALFLLFAVHKIPANYPIPKISAFKAMLGVLGFSYVVLRLYEVGDAVRSGRHRPPDFGSLVNYLVPFHMLAAGPIQSYDDFAGQPPIPTPPSFGRSLEAIERITTGLFKKYVLANLIEKLFFTGFHAGGPYFLLEIQLNYLWLFLDFSAYSDVSVGIGRLIGVATPENFNRPYLARNVIDFWERWHISLSQFIRRNVFIPIQLAIMRRWDGRSPLLAASLAFTLSFALCGLWHSINIRWLAWGLYQAAGLIACSAYKQFLLRRLGRKGLNRYMANRWVHGLAVVLTFEFAAGAVALVTCPREEMIAWIKRLSMTISP